MADRLTELKLALLEAKGKMALMIEHLYLLAVPEVQR